MGKVYRQMEGRGNREVEERRECVNVIISRIFSSQKRHKPTVCSGNVVRYDQASTWYILAIYCLFHYECCMKIASNIDSRFDSLRKGRAKRRILEKQGGGSKEKKKGWNEGRGPDITSVRCRCRQRVEIVKKLIIFLCSFSHKIHFNS